MTNPGCTDQVYPDLDVDVTKTWCPDRTRRDADHEREESGRRRGCRVKRRPGPRFRDLGKGRAELVGVPADADRRARRRRGVRRRGAMFLSSHR